LAHRSWRRGRGASLAAPRGQTMSPLLVTVLKGAAYTLLAVVASPLLEGVIRKIKAVIHSRKARR